MEKWTVSTKEGPGRISYHYSEAAARKAADRMARKYRVPVEMRQETTEWPHNTIRSETVRPNAQ